MKPSDNINQILIRASKNRSQIQEFFKKLKRKKIPSLDIVFHQLHETVFQEINCLECTNCCSTISPIVTDKDITRLCKPLRQKPSELTSRYLYIDEDQDYVFKQTPCPFLGDDGYCSVYDDRPKACREYPHTDRSKMNQILSLTAKNALVCPAVFLIYERMVEMKLF